MQLVHVNPCRFQNSHRNHPVRFFDTFFDDVFGPVLQHDRQASPSNAHNGLHVDIYEKENVIVIEVDMPGIAKEDIKLDVKGKQLTLGAERKLNEEIQEEHRYRRERAFGTFERTFSLPFEIDANTVTAKLENGTLRLEIPKPAEQESKLITIN